MSVAQLVDKEAFMGGFYTLQEAARILHIEQPSKIGRWAGKYNSAPVIKGQYGTNTEIGFFDLMEIRFVNYFRRQGVSLQSIRKAAAAARAQFGQDHPFALSNVNFVTDRKQIFLHVAEETGDHTLMDIVSGQQAFYDVIEGFLAEGVSFSPSGLVADWKPEPKQFPNVLLHPLRAHGLPALEENGVPTGALFSLWRAEKQNEKKVADWFEIDLEQVKQAIGYELKLAA